MFVPVLSMLCYCNGAVMICLSERSSLLFIQARLLIVDMVLKLTFVAIYYLHCSHNTYILVLMFLGFFKNAPYVIKANNSADN